MTFKTAKKLIISACKKRDFNDIPTIEGISDKTAQIMYDDYLNSIEYISGKSVAQFLMNCPLGDLDFYAFNGQNCNRTYGQNWCCDWFIY